MKLMLADEQGTVKSMIILQQLSKTYSTKDNIDMSSFASLCTIVFRQYEIEGITEDNRQVRVDVCPR